MSEPVRRPAWLRVLGRWIVLIALGYPLLCVVVYAFQRQLQYYPDPEPVGLPRGEPYGGLVGVELAASDGVALHAWHWPGTRGLTLVVFHGNAGSRLHRLDWIARFHRLGLGVFILDYRGYGGSGGSPSEDGLYRDGEAALRWLAEHGAEKLVLVGESLGSGVAIELAARTEGTAAIAGLVLQAGFSSAVDVARRAYPFLPVSWLMKDRYDNAGKIARVRCPVLVIHGADDRLVPADLGRSLAGAVPPGLGELWIVDGADHNDIVDAAGSSYYERIDEFLRRRVEDAAAPR